jgi:hypothetical protein
MPDPELLRNNAHIVVRPIVDCADPDLREDEPKSLHTALQVAAIDQVKVFMSGMPNDDGIRTRHMKDESL